jgi:ABC-type amino acid transport substrate-binding protein
MALVGGIGAGFLLLALAASAEATPVGVTPVEASQPSTCATYRPPEVLRVATKSFEPFVFVDTDTADGTDTAFATGDESAGIRGLSVDYWDEVATRAGLDYEWVVMETVQDIVDAAATCQADVAIAGISITSEREQVVDFSQPYYLSGQRLVTRPAPGRAALLGDLARGMVVPFFFLVGTVLLISHVVWWFERGHDSDDFPYRYKDGIGEALWWSTVSVITEGEAVKNINTALGRVIAVFWMLVGLFVVAFFTAEVTASWTVAELRPAIEGVDDLPGRSVATVENTASVAFLRDEAGVDPTQAPTLDEALDLLAQGSVDAVVFDAPAVDFRLRSGSPGWSDLVRVDPAAGWDPYGIAVPQGSPLLEQIDAEVIDLGRQGINQDLEQRWLGQP